MGLSLRYGYTYLYNFRQDNGSTETNKMIMFDFAAVLFIVKIV